LTNKKFKTLINYLVIITGFLGIFIVPFCIDLNTKTNMGIELLLLSFPAGWALGTAIAEINEKD